MTRAGAHWPRRDGVFLCAALAHPCPAPRFTVCKRPGQEQGGQSRGSLVTAASRNSVGSSAAEVEGMRRRGRGKRRQNGFPKGRTERERGGGPRGRSPLPFKELEEPQALSYSRRLGLGLTGQTLQSNKPSHMGGLHGVRLQLLARFPMGRPRQQLRRTNPRLRRFGLSSAPSRPDSGGCP